MVVFLYRPARKAGRAFHTGFRFTVEFLYRPARKAGPVLKHIFKVNKMFLYRPARKAGQRRALGRLQWKVSIQTCP